MILNQQPKCTELNERDNSVLLTAFLTEETSKDGGVIFPLIMLMSGCSCHVSLHLSLICTNVSFQSSVRGEILIVIANINVQVHGLVNSTVHSP